MEEPDLAHVRLHVTASPRLNWTVRVLECPHAWGPCSDGNVVGSTTFTAAEATTPLDGYRPHYTLDRAVPLDEATGDGRHVFEEGHRIQLEVNASVGPSMDAGVESNLDELPFGSRGAWVLRRGGAGPDGELPSHVAIDSPDALAAAGWVEDARGVVTTGLNPARTARADLRLAVESAFGAGDLADLQPRVRIAPGEGGDAPRLAMEPDPSLDLPREGRAGWRAPAPGWTLEGVPTDRYQATFAAPPFRDVAGSGIVGGLEVAWPFVVGPVEQRSPAHGVDVQALEAIGSGPRRMEMACEAPVCSTEDGLPTFQGAATEGEVDTTSTDGLRATLYRVWVTNTGDQPQWFNIQLADATETLVNDVEPYRCPFAFTPRPQVVRTPGEPSDTDPTEVANPEQISDEAVGCQFEADGSQPDPVTLPAHEILRKTPHNRTVLADVPVEVGPGRTAEYYVRVYHRTDAASYAPSRFQFEVAADCVGCPASDAAALRAQGQNGVKNRSDVLVEPVGRQPGYADPDKTPLVDASKAHQEEVEGQVDGPGDTRVYRVRVTNGAVYPDRGGHPAEVTVSLAGVDEAAGWDAALRPALGSSTSSSWTQQYTFDNCDRGLCQGYTDMEFLVRVEAPEAGQRPQAGDHDAVQVVAQGHGPGFDDADRLVLDTTVAAQPSVSIDIRTEDRTIPPDARRAALLDLANEGTAPATVELQASAPPGFEARLPQETVRLRPYETRTVPVVLASPFHVEPGSEARVRVAARWDGPGPEPAPGTACGGDPLPPDAPAACRTLLFEAVPEPALQLESPSGDGSSQVVEASPGDVVRWNLALSNTAPEGSPSLEATTAARGPAGWTAFAEPEAFRGGEALDPGETKEVTVTAVVPRDADPGQRHWVRAKANRPDARVGTTDLLLPVDVRG